MIIDLQNQAIVLLQSILFGIILEIIYEVFYCAGVLFCITSSRSKNKRILHYLNNNKHTKTRKVALSIWDFLYFVFITPVCAIFVFGVNTGIVRWYIVLGTILGFAIFKLILGRFVGRALDTLTSAVLIFIKIRMYYPIKAFFKAKAKNKKNKEKKEKREVLLTIKNSKQGWKAALLTIICSKSLKNCQV